jgi:DAACS family dicarboxylate/amino acid:cation (Na+ or H+) symporter
VTPAEPPAADAAADPSAPKGAFLGWWHRSPLYLRIIGALVVGVIAGVSLGDRAAMLEIPSKLILRALNLLAPPLILLAVMQALMRASLKGGTARRLIFLLVLNTTVAILIGLLVANVIRPGKYAKLARDTSAAETLQPHGNVTEQILDQIPRSVFGPLVDNNVIGVILLAVAFGIGARRIAPDRRRVVADFVDAAMDVVCVILHWIIDLVPLGVFGIVASIIGREGFKPFRALGAFVGAVLIGLALQACWYLLRVRFGSWVRPWDLIRGTTDALAMAFSTDSSTATMPVTYSCLKDKVGLREESASMGALVGSNFNNDGTALYEAMAALFIAQLIGADLGLAQQVIVVGMAIVASVGAAGIPEAGLVTMTLVFNAVHLPVKYIAILLTVDWFLDRSRTMVNVMGDMNVSCLLDGKVRRGNDEGRMTNATT